MKWYVKISIVLVTFVTVLGLANRLNYDGLNTAIGMITTDEPYAIMRPMVEAEALYECVANYEPRISEEYRIIFTTPVYEEDVNAEIQGGWVWWNVTQNEFENLGLANRKGETQEYPNKSTESTLAWMEKMNKFYETWYDHEGTDSFFTTVADYSRMIIGCVIGVIMVSVDSVVTIIPYFLGLIRAALYLIGL